MSFDAKQQRARALWRYVGSELPPFAIEPKPGQESVWSYPRPPRVVADAREVVVSAAGVEIARSHRVLRVLETASPPTFYLPCADVDMRLLEACRGSSFCEWKGQASYLSLQDAHDPNQPTRAVAWFYAAPNADFAALRDHLSFYPARVECYVDGLRVQPQPGEFYAGWVTPEVVGPFKGGPGSQGW